MAFNLVPKSKNQAREGLWAVPQLCTLPLPQGKDLLPAGVTRVLDTRTRV